MRGVEFCRIGVGAGGGGAVTAGGVVQCRILSNWGWGRRRIVLRGGGIVCRVEGDVLNDGVEFVLHLLRFRYGLFVGGVGDRVKDVLGGL